MLTPEEIDKKHENRKIQEQKITGIKEQIETRRLQVYVLNLQGFNNHEISEKLEVSLSTIEKDLHELRRFSLKWFKDLWLSGVMASLVSAYAQLDLILRELWQKYRATDDNEFKLKVLSQISDISIKKFSMFNNKPVYLNTFQNIELESQLLEYEKTLVKDCNDNCK